MRSVPIWLLRFCSKLLLIFIECVRRNLQVFNALFIIQTSIECPAVLEDELFSGNRLLRCELCSLLLSNLLSVQFSGWQNDFYPYTIVPAVLYSDSWEIVFYRNSGVNYNFTVFGKDNRIQDLRLGGS